jgi:hypothetical protein
MKNRKEIEIKVYYRMVVPRLKCGSLKTKKKLQRCVHYRRKHDELPFM